MNQAVSVEWKVWADERIRKHDVLLIEGNGKEAITVRLDRVEQWMESTRNMYRTIIGLLLTAIATGICDIIFRNK